LKILGIETSCDETAAAVVEKGKGTLSNVVVSQIPLHRRYQGVVPELASRAHFQKIATVVEEALDLARIKKPDAIAFTQGPGLMGPLLVGKVAAETLGWLWDCPVIGVNHLEGHIFAAELEGKLRFPLLSLIVSGGHTDLVLAKKPGVYRVLGRTRDDAAGECYDKVAKILGLRYPGGPAIDRLAKTGNKTAVLFPRPFLQGTWDFSFSGLKTALLYHVNRRLKKPMNTPIKTVAKPILGSRETADLCASFQEAVCETLVQKTLLAAKKFRVRQIVVGGGVSANSRLRELFARKSAEEKIPALFSPLKFCADNGAMIAQVAIHKMTARAFGLNLKSDPALPFQNWARSKTGLAKK
jgi:N6-L-threonylcarbamoyladenine synthase